MLNISPRKDEMASRQVNELSKVYSSIADIISRNLNMKDCDRTIREIRTVIDSCMPLKTESEFSDEFVLDEDRREKISKKSEMFFDFLSKLDKEDLRKFVLYDNDTLALFLTVIGVKPSCVISNEIIEILQTDRIGHLREEREALFRDFRSLNVIHNNPNLALFFKPNELLRVVDKNRDVFGDINNINQLINYLKKNPIRMYGYGSCKDRRQCYFDHLRGGILLGIPKPAVVKFSAYQDYIQEYLALIYPADEEEMLFEPRSQEEFEEIKNYRLEKLRNMTVYREGERVKLPEEIINLLSEFGIVRVLDSIPTIAYYRYDYSPINTQYKKFYDEIMKLTRFRSKLKQLEDLL